MANNPLVTIITPAYNCAQFIEETVKSVLDNGYDNIQYIVIDDGSTDDTLDKICKLSVKDSRLWIGSQDNSGEQVTVNNALKEVKGDYFMIVNADDPLLPGAINVLVCFMECKPNILCAYPDWHSINEDGTLRTPIKSREYDFTYMLKHHTCLPSVGSMFRSSLIDTVGYRDASYRWLGDFDYWLRVGLAGQMARVPMTLATWRHRNGQASGDKSDARAQEHIRIIREFYEKDNIPQSIKAVKQSAKCWSYLVAAVVTDSKAKAILYIATAFMHYPRIILGIEFWDIVRRRALHYFRR